MSENLFTSAFTSCELRFLEMLSARGLFELQDNIFIYDNPNMILSMFVIAVSAK